MSIYYLISNLCNNSGCRTKLHKECATGAGLAPCKVSYDPTTAKEMLLMATSLEEQQFWTGRLLKKIQKGGYKAAGQVSQREIELQWDTETCEQRAEEVDGISLLSYAPVDNLDNLDTQQRVEEVDGISLLSFTQVDSFDWH